MDQQKLRTLVFEKTGVRIDIDDPIFALVALNEAVLAEAVERHVALMDDATADLADQLQALHDGGAPLPRPALAAPVPLPAAVAPLDEKRIALIAGGAAVLCAVLVLAGQALFFKPVANELTPAQTAALRDGEKLARIVQNLDAKTRSSIQAEMLKP